MWRMYYVTTWNRNDIRIFGVHSGISGLDNSRPDTRNSLFCSSQHSHSHPSCGAPAILSHSIVRPCIMSFGGPISRKDEKILWSWSDETVFRVHIVPMVLLAFQKSSLVFIAGDVGRNVTEIWQVNAVESVGPDNAAAVMVVTRTVSVSALPNIPLGPKRRSITVLLDYIGVALFRIPVRRSLGMADGNHYLQHQAHHAPNSLSCHEHASHTQKMTTGFSMKIFFQLILSEK